MNLRVVFGTAVLLFSATLGARADSRFWADGLYVKKIANELADTSRTEPERLGAVVTLRTLFTTFGARNFESALPVLKIVRHEPGGVGTRASTLYDDLRIAFKRRDKRIPNPPPIEFDLLPPVRISR